MQELTFEQVEAVSGGFATTLGSPLGGVSQTGPFVVNNYSFQNQQNGSRNEDIINETTITSAICVVKGPTTTCLQSDGTITTSTCVGPTIEAFGAGIGTKVCVNTSTPAPPSSPTPGSVGDYWGV